MSTLREELAAVAEMSREFVAEFFYAPMGVEASPLLSGATLYALLALGAFVIYRLMKPAPHPRYRKPIEYDYGRNH